jgi:predicted TIM-barrel fold metal-dependent hydrolase
VQARRKPPDLIEHPIAIAVRRFPDVRFLVTNAALSTIDMVIRHVPQQENVSFDLSALAGPESDAAKKAYDLLGARRLLLGTHAPFKYPQVALLRAHSTGATGDDLDAMLGKNALELLGAPKGA